MKVPIFQFDIFLSQKQCPSFIFDLAIMYFKKNRFVVGTKLSVKFSLVRRISSILPDRIGIGQQFGLDNIKTIVNVNATTQSSTATHYQLRTQGLSTR